MEKLATATFAENIKATTSSAHTALEQLPVSVSIMNPAITTAEYINYLTLMGNVVKDAEENIFPVLNGVIADIDTRLKTHLIESDLRYLNAAALTSETPLSGSLETISIPFALGILYVIEGSNLGGRVILKNITKALGYSEENGATYFAGYGALTGPKWKHFLDMLSTYEANSGNATEIIEGANYAFEAIHRHFAKEQN